MNQQPDIPGFLDRRPIVWSYSLLHCFDDTCPHQGEARYITKTIKFVETPETKFGNDVHDAFEHRLRGSKPLPESMNRWEKFLAPFDGRNPKVEEWYYIDSSGKACERFAKDKFGHGKIDMTVIENTTAYIGDFKTGNPKYEDPFQLETEALLLKVKHPHLTKIVGQYFWLKEDRLSELYDLSDVAATWQKVCRIMQTIYNYRSIGEYPKNRTPLCGWCQRWDCEHNTNPKKP